MKFLASIIFLLLSFASNACMVPQVGLTQKHIDQFDLLILISVCVAIFALIIRFAHQKSRLWVTSILVLFFGYVPFILFNLHSYGIIGGGGLCGNPGLVNIGQITLGGFSVILLYELFRFIKCKRKL